MRYQATLETSWSGFLFSKGSVNYVTAVLRWAEPRHTQPMLYLCQLCNFRFASSGASDLVASFTLMRPYSAPTNVGQSWLRSLLECAMHLTPDIRLHARDSFRVRCRHMLRLGTVRSSSLMPDITGELTSSHHAIYQTLQPPQKKEKKKKKKGWKWGKRKEDKTTKLNNKKKLLGNLYLSRYFVSIFSVTPWIIPSMGQIDLFVNYLYYIGISK